MRVDVVPLQNVEFENAVKCAGLWYQLMVKFTYLASKKTLPVNFHTLHPDQRIITNAGFRVSGFWRGTAGMSA